MQFVPFEQEDRNIKDITKIIVDQGIMRKIVARTPLRAESRNFLNVYIFLDNVDKITICSSLKQCMQVLILEYKCLSTTLRMVKIFTPVRQNPRQGQTCCRTEVSVIRGITLILHFFLISKVKRQIMR